MRLNRMGRPLAAMVAVVSMSACGDGGVVESFTPEQLGDALLTAQELGSGWSQTQRDVFTAREVENPSIDSSLWCDAAADDDASMQVLAGQAGADAEFEFALQGDVNRGMRVQAWNNADAKEYFETLGSAYDRCNGETWNDGEGSSYTVSPADGPDGGDESLHWAVRIETTDGSNAIWNSRQTAVRLGNTILVMQLGDVAAGDSLEPLGDSEWADIVSAAVEKFESLSG